MNSEYPVPDHEYILHTEYEIFECRPDGSIMWSGFSQMARVCQELRKLAKAAGKEFFAMQMRTREIIFPRGTLRSVKAYFKSPTPKIYARNGRRCCASTVLAHSP